MLRSMGKMERGVGAFPEPRAWLIPSTRDPGLLTSLPGAELLTGGCTPSSGGPSAPQPLGSLCDQHNREV